LLHGGFRAAKGGKLLSGPPLSNGSSRPAKDIQRR